MDDTGRLGSQAFGGDLGFNETKSLDTSPDILTGSTRVLVVDDDPVTCIHFSHVLGKGGYEVDTAGSVQGALAAFEEKEYGLLLTDYFMPDGTGVDLAREVTKKRPGFKIIIASSLHRNEALTAAREENVKAIIVNKPLPKVELLAAIEEALFEEITVARNYVHEKVEGAAGL